jgi:hypothetical protein
MPFEHPDFIFEPKLDGFRAVMDAAREAMTCKQITEENGQLMLAAARRRYATALRRFSRWALDGPVPADLR